MKQKIVIYTPMNEEKSRSKAMTLASKMKGVIKVEVVRDKNLLVVIGEGIDSVKLAKSLRKKFCFANIVSIQNTTMSLCGTFVDQETCFREDDYRPQICYNPTQYSSYQQPSYNMGCPVYNPNPPTICSIM